MILHRLNRVLGMIALSIAGLGLIGMLAVTVVDVVLRYLFQLTEGGISVTMIGSVELVDTLLLITLLGAMAARVERSQVVVEVFTQFLSETMKARIAGLWLLAFAVVGAIMALKSLEKAWTLHAVGQVTQDLGMPMAWFSGIAGVLFAILALRSLGAGLEGLLQGVSHDA